MSEELFVARMYILGKNQFVEQMLGYSGETVRSRIGGRRCCVLKHLVQVATWADKEDKGAQCRQSREADSKVNYTQRKMKGEQQHCEDVMAQCHASDFRPKVVLGHLACCNYHNRYLTRWSVELFLVSTVIDLREVITLDNLSIHKHISWRDMFYLV